MTVEIFLQRLFHTKSLPQGENFTCGILKDEKRNFYSWSVEDTYNPEKIKGVTRIPAGRYRLKINKILTEVTKANREAYKDLPWFKANPNWFHIEITGIPNYAGVYFHSGNRPSDTRGCVLPNFMFDISNLKRPGGNSRMATNLFYETYYDLVDDEKNEVYLIVKDEITV